MFTKVLISVVLMMTVAGAASGHGENKPGPNNGFIRMSGLYHSEVVPQENGSIRVYLLDIHFKELEIDHAKLDATILKGVAKSNAECKRFTEYFECQFQPHISLDDGTLKLKIDLGNNPEGLVVYQLPLQRP